MNKTHARELAEKHLARYLQADGTTILGLIREDDWFFKMYKDVEYQLRVSARVDHEKEGRRVIRVVVTVDGAGLSAFNPLCVDDFRVEGDPLWTTGASMVEEKRERYFYANLGGETVSDITPDCAFLALNRLEKTLGAMRNRVVYAIGYTSQRKHEINRVGEKLPVTVMMNKRNSEGAYLIFPFRVPRFFLIRVNWPQCLTQLFRELNSFLTIRYGILNKKYEKDFLHAVSVNNSSSEHLSEEKIILGYMKNDDEHVTYKINTEARRDDACFREYVSYGKNVPKELIDFHLKNEGTDAL